jgi:serine/threonine protein kinase
VLEPGQVVAGRYVLGSPIGEGAMGTVFRAEDQTLKRPVAIKFLFVKGTRDPQAMVDQFLREARIAASIQHRNVIQTVDFGTFEEFQPFMVMELLSGESLGDRMEREPPLTSEQLIHIVSLTLRGLAAVHDAGIVHRDLKPQNIFLQRDADAVYPKILDFGISRSLQHGGERPSAIATQEGLIVGTPDYMSPEQARGEATIDKRADIYSMAVIVYEGLTGRLPFEANTVGDLIVQIVTAEPPRMHDINPSIPRALSDMVAQAMSKDRENRFADARAMRRALLSAAESALPQGRRASASLAPPTVGLGAAAAPAAAPQPSFALGAAAPASAEDQGALTWGDFEGLHAAQILDNSPPPPERPASAAEPSPEQRRIVARAEDKLDLEPAPVEQAAARRQSPADRPSAERVSAERVSQAGGSPARPRKSGAKRNAAASGGLDVALDPLYAGADQLAPELDLDAAAQSARKPAAPAHIQARVQRVSAKAKGRTKPASRPRYKRSYGPWLLPFVAVALLGYMYLKGSSAAPSHALPGSAPPGSLPQAEAGQSDFARRAAGVGLVNLHLDAKGRRQNPGQAPAHMRDVVF